ncbi:hypothetical protein LIPSTDRAFT_145625 [Lipomyces starkeyi NRRL Y-11557]|uniref:Uncharacterized protein n=1 Tax=Lipomyces starkeyi NRRL Y-11557 TaxID=675824 RepID=A0A1E3Q051_LIPST|nr:hypothetical protein LIPSTDRAFT_145625 [Lipomyces starkeyi NRRL Y-11557]
MDSFTDSERLIRKERRISESPMSVLRLSFGIRDFVVRSSPVSLRNYHWAPSVLRYPSSSLRYPLSVLHS